MFVNPQSSNAADAGECRQKLGMKGLLGWEVQSSVFGNICVCVCVCVCVLGASMFVNPQSSNAADAGECRQKPGMKGLLGWEVQSSVIGK